MWLAAAVTLIVLTSLLLLGSLPRMPWSAVPVNASSRQLAVLPFETTLQDANSRAFAAGLTETLAAKLGEIADRYPLEIISAAEVRKQSVRDAQHARSLLGATIVLEGSLQQSGNTVRIIYSMVDTRSLRQIHSGVITADNANIFAVQDRVIAEVLKKLDIELAKEDRGRMEKHGTAQPEAYDHYLRGRGYLQDYDRVDSLENAAAEFQRSLAWIPGSRWRMPVSARPFCISMLSRILPNRWKPPMTPAGIPLNLIRAVLMAKSAWECCSTQRAGTMRPCSIWNAH